MSFPNSPKGENRNSYRVLFHFPFFLHNVHIYDVQGRQVLRNSCIRNFQFTEVTHSAFFFLFSISFYSLVPNPYTLYRHHLHSPKNAIGTTRIPCKYHKVDEYNKNTRILDNDNFEIQCRLGNREKTNSENSCTCTKILLEFFCLIANQSGQ